MAELRSHAYSLAVRNPGEQGSVLFGFPSGRQKVPPDKIHAMAASPNRKFACIKYWVAIHLLQNLSGGSTLCERMTRRWPVYQPV